MMQLTTNLGLKKPGLNNYINVNVLNENSDIIDAAIAAIKNGTQDIVTLETINKSIAGAINELKASLDIVEDGSMKLELLQTINKTLLGAINELKQKQDTFSTQMADKADKNDLVLASGNIEEIEKQLENYNSYASQKDGNGIFTIVEYKRVDGTLYMKSILSNLDLKGNYQTMMWQLYNNLGTVIEKTIDWTITYDSDGDMVSKVIV